MKAYPGTCSEEASREAPAPGGGPVVLCGLGKVGQAILHLLVRLGREVTVISAEPPAAPPGGAVRVLVGNARDERLLEEAGIHRAGAVIAATDDDLANVVIALHARKAVPEIPVVVRLFDEDLASHLKGTLGVRAAFSASSLSAPAFVAAALGDSAVQAFEAGGEAWVAGEPPGEAGGPHTGIVLTRRQRALPASRREKGAAFLRGLRGAWADMPRGLRFVVFAMLVLVVTSIGIFRLVLRLPLVDAHYFVITTLTTTGYGDISLNSSPSCLT